MRAYPSLLAIALFVAGATPAAAQTLTGRVVELGTDRRIAAATIQVLTQGQSVRATETDSAGMFALSLPRAGWYRVRVERLGYAPAESDTLEIVLGETVEVSIRLRVTAVPLSPLLVVERRSISPAVEFYRRMEVGTNAGRGRFITRETLAASPSPSLSGVLAQVPLVGMEYDRQGKARPVMLSQGGCPATLYLNGSRLMIGPGESLDDMLDPTQIEGVEIYRTRMELPAELAGSGECGAIVMWTRAGEPGRGGRWRFYVAGAAVLGLIALLFTN